MIREFIFVALNIDEAILDAEGSRKDINLIYASFTRLILSTLFVFGVTLYACIHVPTLGTGQSWLIATLVASIIFWFDSAIISAETDRSQNHQSEILQTYAIPAIFWGFINFVLKLVRLSPRIAFSIAIATFIATIAELALQRKAIETVLDPIAYEYNVSTGNKEKRDKLEKEHEDEILRLTTRKTGLENSIEVRGKPNFQERLDALKVDVDALRNRKAGMESDLEILINEKSAREQTLIADEKQVATLKSEIINFQRLMDEERNDPDKCTNPGTEKCEGPNWQRYRNNLRAAEAELSTKDAAVLAENAALKTLNDTINAQEARLNTNRLELDGVNADLDAFGNNGDKSIDQLESELVVAKKELEDQEQENKIELSEFDEDQTLRGLYRKPKDYGFLLLYFGLEELYNDPEKGTGAKQFSWGLFIFIILMELSAVMTTMFFAPYSIYASKAYIKVKERQLEEEIQMSKFKYKRAKELYMSDGMDRTFKTATNTMNEREKEGEPNPTPPPQKE